MPSSLNLGDMFGEAIAEHLAVIQQLAAQQDLFERAAILITDCLLRGNKVLWCGNGGSAADCEHLAAELVGRFRSDRRPLPSIALSADTSVLTAIANDYGYDQVFARQVEALCSPGDVVVGISTSGNSENICAALEMARQTGGAAIALTGQSGGRMSSHADVSLRIPSSNTARIQECHILLGHMLCEWVEHALCITQAMADGVYAIAMKGGEA